MAEIGNERCFYVSSESVTEGHPDKVCDQIADGILDAYLEKDPKARVAIEVMASRNTVMLAGEVTSAAAVDAAAKAREVIRKIGYVKKGTGFDADSCMILTNIHKQSERKKCWAEEIRASCMDMPQMKRTALCRYPVIWQIVCQNSWPM